MMTRSLCPVCYKELPADVAMGDMVYIVRECPDHGRFVGIVERDPQWWRLCKQFNAPEFYAGYLIDVTDRCNLKCKYCYHANGKHDRPAEDIVEDAQENRGLGPIILTGGEPTLHPELCDIISVLRANGQQVYVLSNGSFLDDTYIDMLIEAGIADGNTLNVVLSFHKESAGADLAYLERMRARGMRVPSSFFVIDEIGQIDEAISLHREYNDVLNNIRVKAASNLWNEGGARNKIYTSDMLRYFDSKGPTRLVQQLNNKVSYANIIHDGMLFHLVSWYDLSNIDLEDINCGPWYRAKDGSINNLVTTGLINGGLK
jgi:hypothetical protein